MRQLILADAHVHVHPRADAGSLLQHAAANFAAAAAALQAQRWQGVLLLAEMRGIDWFGGLPADGGVPGGAGWRVSRDTGEAISAHLVAGEHRLLVIAGRQLVTVEGIEVLALGTRLPLADGQSLPETIAAVQEAQAIVVLPWGAGKWLGRRGRVVSAALRRAGELGIFAGDNAGRPVLWPAPPAFAQALAAGRPLLSGTDPLPLANQEQYVGSMGVCLPGVLPEQAPAEALKALLNGAPPDVRSYGRGAGAWPFIVNQARLRMRSTRTA